ncbi:hypothetical protein GF324_11575 [bacterium]|nr:hypothetical protein [bacterium]
MIRAILTIFAWVSGALLFLLIAAFLLLSSRPGERWIESQLETRAGNYQLVLDLGRFETNLISRVQLQDVAIRTIHNSDTLPLARFDGFEIRYRLLPLLRQEIVIDSVGLTNARVDLMRDSSGFLNLPRANAGDTTRERASSSPSPWQLTLKSAGINALDARFEDQSAGMKAQIAGLKLDAHTRDGILQLHTGVDSLVYDAPYADLTVHAFSLGGSYADSGFTVDSLDSRVPGGSLRGSGALRLTQSRIEARVHLQAEAASIANAFRDGIPPAWRPRKGRIDLLVNVEGPFDDLDVHAESRLSDVRVERIHLPDTRLAATYSNQSVTLDSLRMHGIGGVIDASGRLDLIDPMLYRVNLSGRRLSLAGLFQTIGIENIGLDGRMKLTLQGSGPLTKPARMTAGASIRLDDATLYGTQWSTAAVQAGLDKGDVNLVATLGANRLTANGRDLFNTLQAEFQLHAPELQSVAELAGLSPTSGTLHAIGSISGPFNDLAIKVRTATDSLILVGVPIDTFYAFAGMRHGQVIIDSAKVGTQFVVDDNLTRRVEMLEGLRGRFYFNANVSGALDSLRADALLAAGFLEYDTLSVDTLRIKALLDNERIQLQHGFFQRGETFLGLSGRYIMHSADWEARLMHARRDTSAFGWIAGSLNDSIPPAGALRVVGTSGNVDSVSAAPADSLRVALQGNELRLSELAEFYPLLASIQGAINLEGSLQGSLGSPHGQLQLGVRNPGYGAMTADSLGFVLHWKPDSLRLDHGRIFLPQSASRFSGGIVLQPDTAGPPLPGPDSRFEFKLNADSLRLEEIRDLLAQDSLEMSGLLAYDLHAFGTLNKPRINGSIRLKESRFRTAPSQPFVDSIEVMLSFEDTLFIIEKARAHSFDTHFDLSGRVSTRRMRQFRTDLSLHLNDSIAVKVEGLAGTDTLALRGRADSLRLHQFRPFVPDVDSLGGMLNVKVNLAGRPDQPDISGDISIHDLLLQSGVLPVDFEHGDLQAGFHGDSLVVDSLHALANGGRIGGSALVVLNPGGHPSANGTLQVGKVRFSEKDTYTAAIDTINLQLSTRGPDYRLSGIIDMGEVRYTETIGLQTLLRLTQGRARVSRTPDTTMFDRLQLSIRLVNSDQLWVDNNLAELRASAEFEIVGSPSRPTLNGRLRIVEGHVNYLDREFEILTGTLDFNDPDRINPYVNLSAEAEVTEYRSMDTYRYTITLSITGEMDQTEITLTSDPPLDRANIISLLTLGSSRQQSAGGGSAGTEQLIGQRAGMLAGQQLASLAGQRLGLSELTIEGNLFADDRATSPRIFATKQVTDDLEITYITRIGYLDEHGIRLNYYLTDHFSVEGQAQQNGESGINLRYRIRFR